MVDIYSVRKNITTLFVVAAVAVVGFFMYFSSNLVKELTRQEEERMEIWADATRRIADSEQSGDDVDFMLSVIEANRNIPVILTDDSGAILGFRNIEEDAVTGELHDMIHSGKKIEIQLGPSEMQYLYYQDSLLLRRLALFPYIQIIVMVIFVLTVYFAVMATKKAEQNKVWIGLSKETAHQLGTPISSLMAWLDLLRDDPSSLDEKMIDEMDSDVERLADVASRFSKIGSSPALASASVAKTVERTLSYMRPRVSSGVTISLDDRSENAHSLICMPLTEWVLECLIKNAVDAMDGHGQIKISLFVERAFVCIEVADNGKGIPSNRQKRVFMPGYTTKERGWGLGLTLARRIITDYQRGKIFVKESVAGEGTTIRIELPVSKSC